MKNKNKKQSHQLYVLLLNYLLLPVSISNKELKLLMNCAVWTFTFDSACMFCQDQRITSTAFFFSFTKITKHALIRRRLYPGQSLILSVGFQLFKWWITTIYRKRSFSGDSPEKLLPHYFLEGHSI